MDPTRRRELLGRRRQMQDELRRRQQEQAYYSDVRWLVEQLEQRAVPFAYVHDHDPLGDWLRSSFPFDGEEIDWWRLEHRRLPRFRYSRREDGEVDVRPTSDAVVHRWLSSVRNQQRLPGERITAFHGSGTAAVELALDDVVRHGALFAREDCWLIPASRTWVIQCTNPELVWARPAPQAARRPE